MKMFCIRSVVFNISKGNRKRLAQELQSVSLLVIDVRKGDFAAFIMGFGVLYAKFPSSHACMPCGLNRNTDAVVNRCNQAEITDFKDCPFAAYEKFSRGAITIFQFSHLQQQALFLSVRIQEI